MFDIIDRVVVKYISENRRIIVPELGAFMRKDSGEVVFVEFLKRPDGVLKALLRNNTTLNETQANIAIEEFVAKVRGNIERHGSYVIDGLGSLFRDKDGIYELSYDPNIKATEPVVAPAPPAEEQKTIEERVEKSTNAPNDQKTIGDQAAPETIADRLARDVHYREVSTESRVKTVRNDTPPERPILPPTQRRVEEKRPEVAEKRRQVGGERPEVAEKRRQVGGERPEVAEKRRQVGGERPEVAEKRRQVGGERPEVAKKRSQEGGERQNAPKRTPRPRPQQRPARVPEQRKRRADLVMIIAIVAALLAIGAMIFGAWSDNSPLNKIQPTAPVEQVEQSEGVEEQSGSEVN